jgi:hypothetical protein
MHSHTLLITVVMLALGNLGLGVPVLSVEVNSKCLRNRSCAEKGKKEGKNKTGANDNELRLGP